MPTRIRAALLRLAGRRACFLRSCHS
jgi:hypothetical protein